MSVAAGALVAEGLTAREGLTLSICSARNGVHCFRCHNSGRHDLVVRAERQWCLHRCKKRDGASELQGRVDVAILIFEEGAQR
jgi:hypothetical protein